MAYLSLIPIVLCCALTAAEEVDLFKRPPSANPLGAVTQEGRLIKLTEEQAAMCVSGGGCELVPRDALKDKIKAERRNALMECRNAT